MGEREREREGGRRASREGGGPGERRGGMHTVIYYMQVTTVYLHSVDPRKLGVHVEYYIVHMYSMLYHTYGSS